MSWRKGCAFTALVALLTSALFSAPPVSSQETAKKEVTLEESAAEAKRLGRLALCEGTEDKEREACLVACGDGWPLQEKCSDWRRFGDIGFELLRGVKKGDDAKALEARAIKEGMKPEDAKQLRWYASLEYNLLDPDLLPKIDMADKVMAKNVDGLLYGPSEFEVYAAHHQVGKYRKSADIYAMVFKMLREELGEKHYRTVRIAIRAGKYAWYAGDEAAALDYFRAASRGANAIFPEGHPWRAESNLYYQAILHILEPGPKTSLQILEQSQREINATFGQDHIRATRAQMLFGRALAASGDIPRARHVIFHAIRAMRHTISDSAPFTGHGYMEFANVALLNGEDWLAKLALTKAQILLERYHEPDHAGRIRYHLVSAKVHRRWAQRWLDEESMKTAEKHAKMAAGMLEQQLGKDNAALSPYYLELALIYREQYNVKEALKYGVDALKLTNATFGGVHPRNLDSLDNHLELLVAGNLPEKALDMLGDVHRERLRCCGETRELIENRLVAMRAYHLLGKTKEALAAGKEALSIWRELIWDQLIEDTDNMRSAFLLMIAYRPLHHVYSLQEGDEKARFETYLNWQGTGIALARAQKERQIAIASLDKKGKEALAAWEGHREGDKLLPPEVFAEAKKVLEDRKVVIDPSAPKLATMDEICAALAARDATLVAYQSTMKVDAESSRQGETAGDLYYAAYTLTPDCKLGREELGSVSEIDTMVATWRGKVTEAQQCYKSKGSPLKCYKSFLAMEEDSALLYKALISPVAKNLEKDANLLVVPDKSLASVSFDGLVDPVSKRYLVEDHQVDILPFPSALLEPGGREETAKLSSKKKSKSSAKRKRSALVVGDIDYSSRLPSLLSALETWQRCTSKGCDENFASKLSSKELSKRVERVALRGEEDVPNCGVGVKWAPLRTEARAVAEILGAKFGGEVSLVTGDTAVEPLVADAMQSRDIVHIATHGFFADEKKCYEKMFGGDLISALERVFEEGGAFFDITGLSSIVLSGAEQPFDASTSGLDGMMDGSELGALDLTRAELVTLSACETGVGTEFAGDGVHALSRSFLEAGARRVVSSLWQVPSEPTSRLFIDLYTTYASPKKEVPLPRAFREAKLAAIARARASGVQHSSFLWAAFPMVVTR